MAAAALVLQLGQEVDIASRTWPGINKPGGHATIAAVYRDADGAAVKVDVRYVLGGREAGVEMSYVRPHVVLERRARSRRMDAKMNAGALGGVVPEKGREAKEKEKRGKGRSEGKRKRSRSKGAAKKRKALANIGSGANVDEDSGSKAADKMAKTGAAPRAEGAGKKPAAKTASSAGATKKSVSKKQPLPQSISAMSFGPHLQSKLKQLSSKIHMNVSRDDALVSYSPNSILAVHHAHARSPPAAGASRQSIGFSPSLPPGTLPVRGAQDAAEEGGTRTGAARAASRPRHPVMTPPGAGNGMRRAEEDTDGIGGGKLRGATEASSGKPTMVLQELYKSQCKKADTFVDYMVGRPEAKAAGNGKQAAVASSPSSSSEEGGLELKLDPRRLSLFNSLLAEILYLTGHDVLDVRELLEKLGTRCRAQSAPPFTVLEIRPYLQKLEDEGRIFLEEEGGREVVYACGV